MVSDYVDRYPEAINYITDMLKAGSMAVSYTHSTLATNVRD